MANNKLEVIKQDNRKLKLNYILYGVQLMERQKVFT